VGSVEGTRNAMSGDRWELADDIRAALDGVENED
jgi:hypothetical protein